MTALLPANIPPAVNTVEKLALWSLGILYQLHKNNRYQESEAAPLIPLVTAQDGLAADKNERIIFRISMPLNQNWRESSGPFWLEGTEIANAPIPPQYLP